METQCKHEPDTTKKTKKKKEKNPNKQNQSTLPLIREPESTRTEKRIKKKVFGGGGGATTNQPNAGAINGTSTHNSRTKNTPRNHKEKKGVAMVTCSEGEPESAKREEEEEDDDEEEGR